MDEQREHPEQEGEPAPEQYEGQDAYYGHDEQHGDGGYDQHAAYGEQHYDQQHYDQQYYEQGQPGEQYGGDQAYYDQGAYEEQPAAPQDFGSLENIYAKGVADTPPPDGNLEGAGPAAAAHAAAAQTSSGKSPPIAIAVTLVVLIVAIAVAAPFLLKIFGKASYDVTLTDGDGRAESLADVRGDVMLIHFWSAEDSNASTLRGLQTLYEEYLEQTDFRMFLVTREGADEGVSELDRRGLSLPAHSGPPIDEWPVPFNTVREYPTTFVISRDGSVALRHESTRDWGDSDTSGLVARLLEE